MQDQRSAMHSSKRKCCTGGKWLVSTATRTFVQPHEQGRIFGDYCPGTLKSRLGLASTKPQCIDLGAVNPTACVPLKPFARLSLFDRLSGTRPINDAATEFGNLGVCCLLTLNWGRVQWQQRRTTGCHSKRSEKSTENGARNGTRRRRAHV